ncbi:prolipoprotein diacylglyceryl transferase [Saccharopolyspora endophytica]|uniref:Phosphatidylglycerol--prolipoprotein diacylglyceryl transferase n=1 Tax=Saccharopolyspora endophytica TaxID=543886 RepID=A0ABS5DEK4_9PSEU|nr:prolipoprotein diacylglyceryl transferase [Saccharopolyspora endophytica]MBQ0924732.1 prolipoprotein diacylglyceryl transferase [Saccharopolyspora endophytica]
MNATVAASASPLLANIPSPPQGVWYIGPIPLRAYALCIIAGIVLAVWISSRRWIARGGREGTVVDVAVWAVPFGLIGGRLYHVATDWYKYFGPDRNPLDALKVWEGGLGIWGAVALGAVGAWIGCRQRGVPLPAFADTVAPGLVLAQAVGRLGNWFNQELYGGPTTVPWGLEIYRRIDPDTGLADPIAGVAVDPTPITVVHPTFLYELLWNVGVFLLVLWADRKFRMGHGRVFALYVAGYTAGRVWIEMMRSDEATHILGIRINVFTSLVVFLGAVIYLLVVRGKREDPALLAGKPYPDDIPSTTAPGESSGTEDSDKTEDSDEESRDRTADDDDPEPKRSNGDGDKSENSHEDEPKNADEDEAESKGSDADTKDSDEEPAEPATASKQDDGKATKSETDTKDAKTQS